ncbi:MAG: hypothetical protein WA705_28870 [Candidatus Ozemobacteraceae bacterium]
MKKSFCYRSIIIIFVASLLFLTACQFNPFSNFDGSISPSNLISGAGGQSKVAFSIVLPDPVGNPKLSAIRASTTSGPSVIFRLWQMTPENPSKPFIVQAKTISVIDGKAEVEFTNIPAVSIIADMQIENGSIVGYTDFNGAADLNPGSNTVYLTPVGSQNDIDVTAQVYKSILNSKSIFAAANKDKLIGVIKNLVGSYRPIDYSASNFVLQEFFKTLSSLSAELMRVEIPMPDPSYFNAYLMRYHLNNGLDWKYSQIWSGKSVSATATEVIRSYADGFALVRWLNSENSTAYLSTIASDGTRLGSLEVPNGSFSQILVLLNGSIVAGGRTGRTPFLCLWSGKSDKIISDSSWTSPEWKANLESFIGNTDVPQPSITFVQLMGESTLACGITNRENKAITRLRVNINTGIPTILSASSGFTLLATPLPNAVQLDWTPVYGETKYQLYISSNAEGSVGSIPIDVENCTFLHEALSAGASYTYAVKTASLQPPRWSNIASATVLPPEETKIEASLTARLPANITQGTVVPLECHATSTAGLSLSYSWVASPGIIIDSNSPIATWTPAEPGSYSIFCTVSDNYGRRVNTNIQVNVSRGITLSNVGDIAFISVKSPTKIVLDTSKSQSFGFSFYPLNQATDTLFSFLLSSDTVPSPSIVKSTFAPVAPGKPDYIDETTRNAFPLAKATYQKWLSERPSLKSARPASFPATWTFYYNKLVASETLVINAELRYPNSNHPSSKNCLIYVDTKTWADASGTAYNAKDISEDLINKLGEEFDNKIYSLITTVYGPSWDKNRDGRVTILITPVMNMKNYAGVFWGIDLISKNDGTPLQNDRDMFFVEYVTPNNFDSTCATLVHEFQHLANFVGHLKGEYEESWLNEALSVLSEVIYTGNASESSSFINKFVKEPSSFSLTQWTQRSGSYGASVLFSLYMYEQLGTDTIRNLCQSPLSGIANVNQYCQNRGGFINLFKSYCAPIMREGRTDLPFNPVYDYRTTQTGIKKDLKIFPMTYDQSYSAKLLSLSLNFVEISAPDGYTGRNTAFTITDTSSRPADLGVTIVRLK